MHGIYGIAILAALVQPGAVAGQRINGRVIDSSTLQPIAYATIKLVRDDVDVSTAVSDSAGRFVLAAPEGRYRMVAVRIGYADAQSEIIDISGASVSAELMMSVEAVEVAPLTLSVPRVRYLESRGFYERQTAGTGDYKTGDEISKRNPQTLVDVLRGMRGVKIQRINWKNEVIFAGANCLPQVTVDGVTVRYGGTALGAAALQMEDVVNIAHVDGIEVYRGGGVPIEFEGPNASCGVIVIWTRHR